MTLKNSKGRYTSSYVNIAIKKSNWYLRILTYVCVSWHYKNLLFSIIRVWSPRSIVWWLFPISQQSAILQGTGYIHTIPTLISASSQCECHFKTFAQIISKIQNAKCLYLLAYYSPAHEGGYLLFQCGLPLSLEWNNCRAIMNIFMTLI